MLNIAAALENDLAVLQKLNIELAYDLAIPLQVYTQENWKCIHAKAQRQMLMAALFIIDRKWKQPKCPPIWIDKQNSVYLYTGILFSHIKE